MDYQKVWLDKFDIIGKAIRTSNLQGGADRDIPKFWKEFYENNYLNIIPNKVNPEVIGLYTDHESDFKGKYTLIGGAKVNSTAYIPEGFVTKHIPEGRYAYFNCEGKFPDSLIKVWNFIWKSDLKRRYSGDLEIYGKNFNLDKRFSVWISILD